MIEVCSILVNITYTFYFCLTQRNVRKLIINMNFTSLHSIVPNKPLTNKTLPVNVQQTDYTFTVKCNVLVDKNN